MEISTPLSGTVDGRHPCVWWKEDEHEHPDENSQFSFRRYLSTLEYQSVVEHTGMRPLHVAASYDRPSVAALLLDRGAAVDAKEASARRRCS